MPPYISGVIGQVGRTKIFRFLERDISDSDSWEHKGIIRADQFIPIHPHYLHFCPDSSSLSPDLSTQFVLIHPHYLHICTSLPMVCAGWSHLSPHSYHYASFCPLKSLAQADSLKSFFAFRHFEIALSMKDSDISV
jgi:hypothetical protein